MVPIEVDAVEQAARPLRLLQAEPDGDADLDDDGGGEQQDAVRGMVSRMIVHTSRSPWELLMIIELPNRKVMVSMVRQNTRSKNGSSRW